MIYNKLKNLSTMIVTETGQLKKIVTNQHQAVSLMLLDKMEQERQTTMKNCIRPLQISFLKALKFPNPEKFSFNQLDDEVKLLLLAVSIGLFSEDFFEGKGILDLNHLNSFMAGFGSSDLNPLILREITRVSHGNNGKGVMAWLRYAVEEITRRLTSDTEFKTKVEGLKKLLLQEKENWLIGTIG